MQWQAKAENFEVIKMCEEDNYFWYGIIFIITFLLFTIAVLAVLSALFLN